MSNEDNRSQKALANPAQLQATLDVIPAYTWYAAPSGGLTFVNKRTADYLGLPKDHPLRFGIDIGAQWDAHIPLLHPDDHEETRRIWSICLRTGEAGEVSFRVRNAQGGYRWFLSRVEPLRASDGTLLQWVGVNLDIEELKCAERALRESEAKVRDYAETASDWFWEIGPDYKFTLLTKNAFGADPAGRIGTTCWDHALDVESGPEKWRLLWATLDSRKPFRDFVYCSAGANGSPIYVKTSGKPVFDSDGEFRGYRGTGTDVTATAKAEGALRESEYKLRQIIETMPSFHWSTGPDGEPTQVNQRVLDYSGMQFEDFLRLGWKEFLHPDDFSETANAFYHAIQTGTSYQAMHRLRRADGEYRWYQARAEPLRDQQGRIIQWYGLSIDIDEGKRAEDQLRSTQTRLARASQIATVAELSASIAHEINQPLAAIIANAQTCQTWLFGDIPNLARARVAVDRIVRDATAAAEVVRRIRALFTHATPDKSQLQMNEVIHEVWQLVQSEMSRRGVFGEFDLAQQLPPIAADRIQIQQALVNLIRNAAEAMERSDDPKRLIVRSRHVDSRIVVEVCDSGPGLADKEKAFEPFHSTKQKGMGVGLSISRSIVQAHEGELWARDNAPQGTIFTLTLPAPRSL